MIDGPIVLEMNCESIMVYRKVFEDGHDSYATVGSRYAEEHPDEVTPERIERLLDESHESHGERRDEGLREMWRGLFAVFEGGERP